MAPRQPGPLQQPGRTLGQCPHLSLGALQTAGTAGPRRRRRRPDRAARDRGAPSPCGPQSPPTRSTRPAVRWARVCGSSVCRAWPDRGRGTRRAQTPPRQRGPPRRHRLLARGRGRLLRPAPRPGRRQTRTATLACAPAAAALTASSRANWSDPLAVRTPHPGWAGGTGTRRPRRCSAGPRLGGLSAAATSRGVGAGTAQPRPLPNAPGSAPLSPSRSVALHRCHVPFEL